MEDAAAKLRISSRVTLGESRQGRAENWAKRMVRPTGLAVIFGITGCSSLMSLMEKEQRLAAPPSDVMHLHRMGLVADRFHGHSFRVCFRDLPVAPK